MPYPAVRRTRSDLLVTGGSQGARIMSDIVPAAIALLPAADAANSRSSQQARGEDEEHVRARLCATWRQCRGRKPFFTDLPARMAAAHLVIARAGASTVAELSVIGRPSILVPFPHAIDQDQAANAAHLAAEGAAILVAQTEFSPQWLATALQAALGDPAALAARAAAAKRSGHQRCREAACRSRIAHRASGD